MTSLPFTNTLSASAEAATHTDRVTSTERDEVSDKERQRVQRKRNTPIDCSGCLVWFWDGLWSGPVWPTLTAETLGSTGAHPCWQREREGWREKQRQAVITKTTTARFCDGPPGENRWVIRSGWARCCAAIFENLFYTCVALQQSVVEMWRFPICFSMF